ncbi:Glycosyl hydrolases family 43 [Porphyromonadaceae bacterium NLAE-zl-C104]|nr:Glycosyl hydrolases family 43 [Porphyromonadaceae bacterium NLAE-zl-C104]
MKNQEKNILLLSATFLLSCADTQEQDKRPAQVETLDAQEITDITAVCKGRITDKGTGVISQYGIELNDGSGYVKHPRTMVPGNDFEIQFSELSPGQTYHYRAYIDDGTVQYGNGKSFTTLQAFAYTAGIDPASITNNSVTVSFSLTDHLKEWGVHYSESEVTINDPVKTGFLKSEITLKNLKSNTTYNILPFIVDKGGETTYLEIISFSTAKDTYSNPIVRSDAPDPTVIRATDGIFYLYHTGIGIYHSSNLIDWKYLGKAFTDAGRPDWEPNGGLWAPDINYINGKYVMYYSLSVWGGEWTCGIGVATSDRPEGPFTDRGKLFRSNEIGVQNSIDPFYMEDNGKKYLFWGSFRGIYGIELTDNGLNLKSDTEKQEIAGTYFEGTYIHKRGNFYYLFGSIGSCCEGLNSTYTTVVGRSENLWGPYVNKSGGRMLDNKYEVVIQGNNYFKGTGHNSEIMQDKAGNDWILYHAYEVAHSSQGRQVLMDRINWEDNWPVVKNSTPSTRSEVPEF